VKIVVVLFDRVTALDAIGPYEVLQRTPGADLVFAAHEPGEKRTETGRLGLIADVALAEIPEPDVIVMPGGFGTRAAAEHQPTLDWLRHAHQHSTFTTSVCTGSLVLGAAGLLDGLEATTHWAEMEALAGYGATPTERRVVEQGRIITAAGVSSGIDMALTVLAELAGDDIAKAVQLGIEYDPQPPFDAGSVAKAGPELTELVRAALQAENEHPADLDS
jgi:transcriptional regulator GlxA family with amidase domain